MIQLSPEIQRAWKAGLGTTPAFKHRPGTANVRPFEVLKPTMSPVRAIASRPRYRIVGMTNSAPLRMPVGQREVIVFSRV